MKFIPIAILVLFTLTANAQVVERLPGHFAVWSNSLEDEDVWISFQCLTSIDFDGLAIAVRMDGYQESPPNLTYVRITNNPNRGWLERVWVWDDDGIVIHPGVDLNTEEDIINPFPGIADMVLEEKPIFFELSMGPMSTFLKIEYTFPLNGAREAMADFPCLE